MSQTPMRATRRRRLGRAAAAAILAAAAVPASVAMAPVAAAAHPAGHLVGSVAAEASVAEPADSRSNGASDGRETRDQVLLGTGALTLLTGATALIAIRRRPHD